MIAAMNGNYPVVKLLAGLGANLLLVSIDYKTAKDFA